jgi:hypothetical protein
MFYKKANQNLAHVCGVASSGPLTHFLAFLARQSSHSASTAHNLQDQKSHPRSVAYVQADLGVEWSFEIN